jgi:hypothetical protein
MAAARGITEKKIAGHAIEQQRLCNDSHAWFAKQLAVAVLVAVSGSAIHAFDASLKVCSSIW